MTEDNDRLPEILAALPAVTPDAGWESRVQARCHEAIARREVRRSRARRFLSAAEVVRAAAAAALGLYLAAVLWDAVRLASGG